MMLVLKPSLIWDLSPCTVCRGQDANFAPFQFPVCPTIISSPPSWGTLLGDARGVKVSENHKT